MSLKRAGLVIAAVVLMISGSAGAQLITNAEFIALGNINQMGAAEYNARNDYDYRFVNGASDISDGSDFDAFRDALGTWVDLPDSDLYASEITKNVAFTPGSKNGYNDIAWIGSGYGYTNSWADLLGFSSSAVACVVTWYAPHSGAVKERDMYFNDINYDWHTETDGDQSEGFHVGHIALHELGHIFGLVDVYNPGQSGWQAWMGTGNEHLTMYGISGPGNEDMTLTAIDIAAMALLHPAATVPEPKAAIMFMMAGGILFAVRKPQ